MMRTRRRRISCSDCVSGYVARPSFTSLVRPLLHVFDWTNWTFWVTAIALVAFGFASATSTSNGASAKLG